MFCLLYLIVLLGVFPSHFLFGCKEVPGAVYVAMRLEHRNIIPPRCVAKRKMLVIVSV